MRVRLWFIILVFTGVLLIGLISLPFGLFLPWDDVFGDGGVADWFLNVFTYGLLFILIVIPLGLMGVVLIWQPRDGQKPSDPEASAHRGRLRQPVRVARAPQEPYRLWKLALGVLLAWFAIMLTREVFTSETPFPTSKADAARRAAEN